MTGDGSDLPYYDGRPVAVDGRGWALLMASLALAFAVLTLTPPRGFPATWSRRCCSRRCRWRRCGWRRGGTGGCRSGRSG